MLTLSALRQVLAQNQLFTKSSNRILSRNESSVIESENKLQKFESILRIEKKRAKKYLLIEDKTHVLSKLNVKNISQLLDYKINKIFKWIYNKHNCLLIELNDENYFMRKNIRKSFSLKSDSMSTSITRFWTITHLPNNFVIHSNSINKNNEFIPQFNSRKSNTLLLNTKELKTLFNTNEEFLQFLLRDKHLTELELKLRFYIIRQLEEFVCNGLLNKFTINPFGSSIAGFGTSNSDLDLVLMPSENMVLNSYNTRREDRSKMISHLKIVADLLQYSVPNFSHFSRIFKARIPIIKFWFDLAPIDIDLSIELSANSAHSGVVMSSFLYHCHQLHPCVRDLIILIKIWAKQHDILKPNNWSTRVVFPGFTSFQLTSLVIYFLQKQQIIPPMAVFIDKLKQNNTQLNNKQINSIDLMRQFFEFVLDFNHELEGISILNATAIANRDFSPIYVQNPFEHDLNVCKNIDRYEFTKFMNITQSSLEVMNRQNFNLVDVFDKNIKIITRNTKLKKSLKIDDLFTD